MGEALFGKTIVLLFGVFLMIFFATFDILRDMREAVARSLLLMKIPSTERLTARTPRDDPSIINRIYSQEIFTFRKKNIKDYDTLTSMYARKDNNICAMFSGEAMVGFYAYGFLKRRAFLKIADEECSISNLIKSDFTTSDDAFAVYICNITRSAEGDGNVPDVTARKHTLAHFCATLWNTVIRKRQIRYILCKPISDQGRALAEKFCFEPLRADEANPLYILDTRLLPSSYAATAMNRFFPTALSEKSILACLRSFQEGNESVSY